MSRFLSFLALAGALLTGLSAAERIPPAPERHFNDYAGAVSPGTATRLNGELEQYERASSNQILVAIFPRMESDSSVEDYTVRVAQAWNVGQKEHNNGVVLFAFMQERQLYIQVGYGLEARIPDVLAKRIIEQEIVPRFKQGDRDGGMQAAVSALIAATKGEYKGTGQLGKSRGKSGRGASVAGNMIGGAFILGILLIVLFGRAARRIARTPTILGNPRRGGYNSLSRNIWMSGGNFGGGRSHSSWGGGGGGFSGGGGSFGGGGAGGKW